MRLVAAFAGALSNLFAGMGQELFNAAILGIAVVMLTWHNVWMARHGREMASEVRAIGQAVAEGSKSLLALAVVVGVAVLREGSEVALFLYGIVTSDGGSALNLALGGVIGLVLGALVCMLTYAGLISIPMRSLFAVTTVLITLLAAGMAAQAVAFLEKANWLTALDNVVWGLRRGCWIGIQHPRQGAPYLDRLHRPADHDAARRLSGDPADNLRADAVSVGSQPQCGAAGAELSCRHLRARSSARTRNPARYSRCLDPGLRTHQRAHPGMTKGTARLRGTSDYTGCNRRCGALGSSTPIASPGRTSPSLITMLMMPALRIRWPAASLSRVAAIRPL